jgi:hypothetical protein
MNHPRQRQSQFIAGQPGRVTKPSQQNRIQPKMANAIQLHPLAIKIDGYQEWRRDTGEINIDEDIDLFQQKINSNNPRVTSIEVRKKSVGDHQVVVIGTEDGKFTQMDLSSSGTMLRYDVDQEHYSVVVGTFTPRESLQLHDAFREFYRVTHARGFHFEDYNCMRFANDLAGGIGTAERNPDMDFLF